MLPIRQIEFKTICICIVFVLNLYPRKDNKEHVLTYNSQIFREGLIHIDKLLAVTGGFPCIEI